MLKIYGSGKLRNLGQLKIYNQSSYFDYVDFPYFTSQFGLRGIVSTAILGRSALTISKLYISNPISLQMPYYLSGSPILRPWTILNNDGSLNTTATGSISNYVFYTGNVNSFVVESTQGKIIAGYDGSQDPSIQRFNLDNLDVDFKVKSGSTNNNVGATYALAVQSDKKIIAGGNNTWYSGSRVNKVFRINDSGSLDSSFNSADGFNSESVSNYLVPLDIKIQSDGKIMVVGSFSDYYVKGGGGIYTNSGSVRINSNGTIDTTFKNKGGFSGSSAYPSYVCRTVDINSSTSKIIMGGDFSHYSGSGASRIVRTDNSGAIDSTFNTGSGFNQGATIYKVLHQNILPNSAIYVAGYFTSYSGSTVSGIVRLLSSGAIDTTFKTGGGVSGSYTAVYNMSLDGAGGLYVVGDFLDYSGSTDSKYASGIMRLNASNGTVDESFNPPGYYYSNAYSTDIINAGIIKKDSSNRYVVVGNFETVNNSLAKKNTYSGIFRYDSNFNFDQNFNPGLGIGNTQNSNTSFAFQSDNKIILVGNFAYYSGSVYSPLRTNGIVRINTDGTKDNTFITGSGFSTTNTNLCPYAIAIQPSDNKSVVVGSFLNYSGSNSNRIVRINTDGTKDDTFITGSGLDGNGYAIAMQTGASTKILVGGSFLNYSGSASGKIVRINSDGTKDTTFNAGTGFDNTVTAILSQSDGKIMVGGQFTTYNGSSVPVGLVRLNSDGTLDSSFNPGGAGFGSFTNYYPIRIIQKSDFGYIILVKTINSSATAVYNGQNFFVGILGLNNDGTYNFNTSTYSGNYLFPSDIVELADGNLVVVGNFYNISGSYQCNIAKIAPNGRISYPVY